MALATVASLAYAPLIRWGVRRALPGLEARSGQPIVIAEIEPIGLSGVELLGVSVGPEAEPVFKAARVSAFLDVRGLLNALRGRLRPGSLELVDYELAVRGDGTSRGFVRALEALRPKASSTGSPSEAGPPLSLPVLRATHGRVLDRAGTTDVRIEAASIDGEGAMTAAFEFKTPEAGPCRFEGQLSDWSVTCERPYRRALTSELSLEIGQARYRRHPQGRLEIIGGRLRVEPKAAATAAPAGVEAEPETEADNPDRPTTEPPASILQRVVDGLLVDAALELGSTYGLLDAAPSLLGAAPSLLGSAPGLSNASSPTERPLSMTLKLPGGGTVEASGLLGERGASLRTEVVALDLAPIDASLSGTLSARSSFFVDFDAERAELRGELSLRDLMVDHRAVADGKVGPYSLSAEGELVVKREPHVKGPRTHIRIEKTKVSLGPLELAIVASAELDGGLRTCTLDIQSGLVAADRIVAAFPTGLLPHLQPVQAAGKGGLKFFLGLDFDHPELTELDVRLDLADFRITRLNPAIDFDELRASFETRFEMPDGEIIRRVTGPLSERWTSIYEVTPLLPIAIVTQEDGGFYRHAGVSLLHLRGSLAKNLETGHFSRGGSTLTMQLARNLFLNRHKTLSRKFEEVVVAWLLEQSFSKDELMALYLNVVEFGPQIFGIRDASRYYFDKAPAELLPVEVAFLTRLLPGPRRYHKQFLKGVVADYYAVWMRRLLELLWERGHITREAYDAAWPKAMVFAAPPERGAAPAERTPR